MRMAAFFLAEFLIEMIFLCTTAGAKSAPNIIFILADDMGWNDVSFHGSPQIPTPNIDALAATGIVLHKYYTLPQCTPSRAALMTGKYPIRLGLQNFVIDAGAPYGLPLTNRILPQYLKDLGYSTHGVGKWHLGFHKKEYTPTYRGFDTFFGYWNGLIDYYDYTNYETVSGVDGMDTIWGIDLHNGTEPVRNIRGQYATDLFTDKAQEIIKNHNTSNPLFLYLSHLACHTGNDYQRMQAPPGDASDFEYIHDKGRRTYARVVRNLDESVGKIFRSLEKKHMLKNSIVVFSSDNGAEPEGIRGGHGSNWPLRSMKFHLYEGGVRTPAVIWSPLFKQKGPRVVKELMHITDWLPTFYSAAGGQTIDLGNIDGMNMWNHLLLNKPLSRKEILLNSNSVDGSAAIINGNLKLITGDYNDGNEGWYGPSGRFNSPSPFPMDWWVWRHSQENVMIDILRRNRMWFFKEDWRQKLEIDCGNERRNLRKCQPKIEPCLFDLENDPCEREDIAPQNPEIVRYFMNKLDEYNRSAVPPILKSVDPKADPRCHGFAYVPWLDEEYGSDCS